MDDKLTWNADDVQTWTFKPTWWQKIKLRFAPVYVGLDLAGGKDYSCEIEVQRIDGQMIITKIKPLANN